MIDVVLGVDSSTQSCTVEVRELETGRLLGVGRAAHPRTVPPVSEQLPVAWWDALRIAVRMAMAESGRVRVLGISVGAQCHGLIALDSEDRVLRPAKLWNDTTSAAHADALLRMHGPAWWAREIGLSPSAAITISKLLWVRDNEADVFGRIAKLCVPHDWLTMQLSGEHVTDRSDASGTGYFSAASGKWRTDILAETVADRDWTPLLPNVLPPEGAAGTIRPEIAEDLGIDCSAVVAAGGGDQHLAAQGIGLQEGDVAFSLGTSGVVFATTSEPVRDESGAIDGVANVTGGYLPLVCTLNAAKVSDAMARLLAVDHAELSRLALAAPPSPTRPVMAAYLDGERSPRLPSARGMISGLTSDMTREQLALAAFEGVVLGLMRAERWIAAHGVDTSRRVILIGGGARSPAYRQIVADFIGRETLTVDAQEATARGAAIQAAAVVQGRTVADVTREWAPAIISATAPSTDRRIGVWERYERLTGLQEEGGSF